MEMQVQTRKNKYENISLVRVLSCLGVLIVHLGQRLNLQGSLRVITDFGANGVYMFFIISGFLAFATYKQEEGICYYWWKRAVRLLPLYYCIVLYNFLVHTFIYKDVPVDSLGLRWFRYIFCLSGIVGTDETFWRNLSDTWTIPMFVFFYLLVPFLYKSITSFKRSIVFMLGIYLLGNMCFVIGHGHLQAVFYLFYFSIGIVISKAILEEKTDDSIALFSILAIFWLVQSATVTLIYAMLFATFIIVSRCWTMPVRIAKGVHFLDKYSYTIYLIQRLVFDAIIDRYSMTKGMIVMVTVLGTLLGSVLVYNIVEKPIQKGLLSIGNKLCLNRR